MACPGALPLLLRRAGDGHSVVREKGEGDKKKQVRGRGGGEEEARQKRGRQQARTSLMFVGAVLMVRALRLFL